VNPLVGGDSGGYTSIAKAFNDGQGGWDHARTPGYPIFVLIVSYIFSSSIDLIPNSSAANAITYIQFFVFVSSIVVWHRSIGTMYSKKIASLSLILISPALVIFSRFILPESLCISLIIFLAVGILCYRPILIGLSLALLLFLKPNFLILTLLVSFFYASKKNWNILILVSLTYITIASLNFLHTGIFSITNISGFARSQVVYNLFDKVHSEDKVLGEILHEEYKDEKRENNLRADIWTRCTNKLYPKTNEMPYEKSSKEWMNGTVLLSKYVGDVSNYLILEHPYVVLQNSIAIFKLTNNYTFPSFDNSSKDPHSVENNMPTIKSNTGFLVYRAIADLSSKLETFLVPLSFLLSLYGFLKTKDLNYTLSPTILFSNQIMISLFGVFDSRYVLVLIPIALIPYIRITRDISFIQRNVNY